MAPTTGTGTDLTIDELAAASGTTVRRVRSLQTLGLLPRPELRGRTGLYGPAHRDRLAAILRLQDKGFSLESIGILFAALDSGRTLADVLGVEGPTRTQRGGAEAESATDTAELYGFADLQPSSSARGRSRRRLLSLVPTTMWDESEAS
ncbi:MAG TPA: MerR family transcriptional regulator [Acidimicrobiales bacterium]|nr:MerR family transcriptional regulator [Acidimicrobiales bacterium]